MGRTEKLKTHLLKGQLHAPKTFVHWILTQVNHPINLAYLNNCRI